jgi:hypothetical protein
MVRVVVEHNDSEESDEAMESGEEDGSELIEEEEMGSDIEADDSGEAGSSDMEGNSCVMCHPLGRTCF